MHRIRLSVRLSDRSKSKGLLNFDGTLAAASSSSFLRRRPLTIHNVHPVRFCFTGPTAASLLAFDEILNGPFQSYLDLSKRIGSEVATIGEMVEIAFKSQRNYLELATKAKQPPQGDLPMLLKPMSDKISEIQSFREAGRRCQYFNHLSAISESIPGKSKTSMMSLLNITQKLEIINLFSSIGMGDCQSCSWSFCQGNERRRHVLYQSRSQGLEG